VGRPYPALVVRGHGAGVGCTVADAGAGAVVVTPPSWRPDLSTPVDLVEEVARLAGYDTIPSRLPAVPPGSGYTVRQRHGTSVSRALAGAGLVEVLSYPFVGERTLDGLGLAADDPRRRAVRLANPLSEEEPWLRTTLLPGLLDALRRNGGRGFGDVALFEVGRVFLPRPGAGPAPRPGVDHRPSDAELAALDAALPSQPTHVGAVWAGQVERAGWWGSGRAACWADAVAAARAAARAIDAPVHVEAAEHAPWHPGRCARVVLDGPDGPVAGYAGELHPRVVAALDLPLRTCAMELDLSLLARYAEPLDVAPAISAFPVALQDVALVVPAATPSAAVAEALAAGAGPLLEQLVLLDVYTGPQVPDGHRSLAYRLRLRAADRTLTAEEALAARDAAVAEAAGRLGAVQRT
jgi:phenylalanyl-tRNA synthetase beta chain